MDATTLGFRLGYRNPAKAAGRVHALCDGHVTSRKSIAALERLPDALQVSAEAVQQALAATVAQKAALKWARVQAEDARWRAGFRPHAVILTERKCPTQIVICGLTGGIGRWLIIPLDLSCSPLTFVDQVKRALPRKLETNYSGGNYVPFFGVAHGFIVNYTPDTAVRFTLAGEPIESLEKAYCPGRISSDALLRLQT
ncbi:hypothetical protein [Bradyrhizobium sp. MOS002]|uniref:hypothetical protein n=1 Tax=Bradyrhizobium sp. MOS002 TaxID=2133947 RepID=UPI0011B1D6AF|nr:hypothetical protein [Bradyrhizobium sp. MOS002]